MPSPSASFAERLRLISPFRWRLEWAVLLVAATAGVLTEQAREARDRDPYQIVHDGRAAQANVAAAREVVVPLGTKRGVPQQETHTLVDLEWQDEKDETRRVVGYRLDRETIAALRIDVVAGRWPAYVRVLYLDRLEVSPRAAPSPLVIEQGVTAATFQRHCKPWKLCRVVVVPPDVLSPTEIAAHNVDYVLDRAPYAFVLSLVLVVGMLALRLVGVVQNRPSLE